MSHGAKIVARGLVIKKTSSGDGSARILLYTDSAGLIWVHAQSAREERSQLRAHIQVGTVGTFSLVRGRDVWRLSGIMDTENMHYTLSGKTESQKALQRVLFFIRQFVRGEGSDPYFFSVLWGFLFVLPYLDNDGLRDAEHAVVLRMLSSLGYVDGGAAVEQFLTAAYDSKTLRAFSESREEVLAMINEGIQVSGLS